MMNSVMKHQWSVRCIAAFVAVMLALGGGLALLGGCASPASSGEGEAGKTAETTPITGKLAIIHTNDTHGYDKAAEAKDKTPGVLGMAAVKQLATDYEAQGYEVLVLDDGDAIQDNSLVNLSQGQTAIEFMNAVGYDAMALGNHEFDWGADNLDSLRDQATFPMLAANVIVEATGEPFVEPNKVFTLESGAKIGVFALETPETQTKSSPKNTAGLTFLAGNDLYECAQQQVDELKAQGCAAIICLGHLGANEGSAPNRSTDVLDHVKGVDVFIDGHDHKVVNERTGDTLRVSTGCHLENIGVVLFEDGSWTENMVAYGAYSGSDAEVAALVDRRAAEVDEQLAQVVGTSAVALNGERDPGVRTQETNLGDFAADALLWQARQYAEEDIDAALLNGGGIRASIAAGEVTLKDIYTVFPYSNSVNVVKLTGAELLEVIEASTFSLPDAIGGFPQVAGMTYTVDTTVPYEPGEAYPNSTYSAPAHPGARVTITDVGGKGFALDATYTFATLAFVTDGGDTYYRVADAYVRNGYITGAADVDAMANYLKTELGGSIDDVYAAPQGRIEVK